MDNHDGNRRFTRGFKKSELEIVNDAKKSRPKRKSSDAFLQRSRTSYRVDSDSDESGVKSRRRRSIAQRSEENGYKTVRLLTPAREQAIITFIQATASNTESNDGMGVYGSERWMDNLIDILDKHQCYDLIYEDIKLWLESDQIFEMTRRSLLTTNARILPNQASVSGDADANASGNGDLEEDLGACLTEPISAMEDFLDLSSTGNRFFTSKRVANDTSQVPEEASEINALSDIKMQPPNEAAANGEANQVPLNERDALLRSSYQAIKKRMENLIHTNSALPEQSNINSRILETMMYMLDSVVNPETSAEQKKQDLIRILTYFLNEVVNNGSNEVASLFQ